MRVAWKGPKVRAKVRGKLAAGLTRAGNVYRAAMKSELSTVGPPPSAPGHPPHIDSQDLYDSIEMTVDAASLEVAVYSTMDYAVLLETGTVNMEPRPSWEPVLRRVAPVMRAGFPR